MRMSMFIAAAALAVPAAAAATELQSCDDAGVGLWAVAPGDNGRGIRTFYDGQVIVFELDTIEPAAAPGGVAIVIHGVESSDGPPGPACWTTVNYGSVDVAGARARYDARQGLTLTIPTRRYDPETSRTLPADPLRLRIDARRGTVVRLDAPRR